MSFPLLRVLKRLPFISILRKAAYAQAPEGHHGNGGGFIGGKRGKDFFHLGGV
jgi:hypothetical protein